MSWSAPPDDRCPGCTSLGHELSHVYNRDILISSVAATLAGALTTLAHLAYLLPFGSSSDDDDGSPLAALLMLILGPLAAGLIQLAISRSRESTRSAARAWPRCSGRIRRRLNAYAGCGGWHSAGKDQPGRRGGP